MAGGEESGGCGGEGGRVESGVCGEDVGGGEDEGSRGNERDGEVGSWVWREGSVRIEGEREKQTYEGWKVWGD